MKLQFKIHSGQGAVIDAEYVMQKPDGLVVIGQVTNSKISEGDQIGIQTGDKAPFYDKIKRIEINHEKVGSATTGQLIGLCLQTATKETLVNYLGN